MDKLRIKVIVGSTRPQRFSEHAAAWIADLAKQRSEMDIEVLDLRDWPLPFYDQPISPSQVKDGNYANEVAKKWGAKIKEADGFILVSPEYNHATSAVLKNALDSVFHEWANKAVGLVTYGTTGGAFAAANLRVIVGEMAMAPVRQVVHIFAPWTFKDDSGNLKPGIMDQFVPAANTMLDQLSAWAGALKTIRK